MKPRVCKNFRDPTAPPGCLAVPDERYTMDFSSIGEDPIYWCSFCGPATKAIDDLLQHHLTNEPGFADKFKDAIDGALRGGK